MKVLGGTQLFQFLCLTWIMVGKFKVVAGKCRHSACSGFGLAACDDFDDRLMMIQFFSVTDDDEIETDYEELINRRVRYIVPRSPLC